MKTVGELVRNARLERKLSIADLEKKTKIKKEFIKALEKEDWESLPDFAVINGFVKSIASALLIDQAQAAAILRRDYPPKKLPINPKPDIDSKFVWTPRLTFLAAVSGVILIFVGYLVFQYFSFSRPPKLEVTKPTEGEVIEAVDYTVSGKTDPDATIVINNQPVIISDDGDFSAEIEIGPETSEVKVVARSRSGKETTVVRTINPRL